jgi:uncharacterized protein YdaU (DUF1376 family)
MKFSPRDFVGDTQHLSCEERGAYIALINYYWINGGLPDDDDRLARIVGLDAMRWQCVRNAMLCLFRPGWRHKRIDEELSKANEKSQKAASSANNRWKDKQKPDNANAKRKHMPTQSEGNANKTTDIELASASSKRTPRSILLECLSSETAEGVIAHRKAKGAPLTELASRELVKGFNSTGDPEDAARTMVARGWQGFKKSWYDKDRSDGRSGKLSVQEAARNLAASGITFGPVPPPYMPGRSSDTSSSDPTRMLSEGGRGGSTDLRGGSGFNPRQLPAGSGLPSDGPEIGIAGEEQVAAYARRGP